MMFAPPARRIEQAQRAEELHDQIEPDQPYPLEFIWYRVTGYRAENTPAEPLPGQDVAPDLRLMIDTLTRSAPIPVDDDQPVESPEQLAARLNVSTKTITRWRSLGLRWRWVLLPDHPRKTLAFTQTAVERFAQRHRHRVARAANLTHLDPHTRQAILDRARRIAQASDASLNRVAKHLARKYHRPLPTLRYVLLQHDRANPDNPIFADRAGPLTREQQHTIARQLRRGVPVAQIADHFGRTTSTIRRAANHHRAAVVRRLRLQYIHMSAFDHDDADPRFMTPATHDVKTKPAKPAAPVDDLPPPLQPLYQHPGSTQARKIALLTQLNYSKYKAVLLRENLNLYEPRAADLDKIESHIRNASTIRNQLFLDSLPVTLSVARRHLIDQPDATTTHLLELLEQAVPVLAEAIDRYDISRKQDFDAYLTYQLQRRFAGLSSETSRAHRKIDPQAAIHLLRAAAAAHGIRLTTPPA